MRKEICKVGYRKPKTSPLQGIEPGSLCIEKETARKISPMEGTEPGFLRPQRLYTNGLHPWATAALSQRLAKNLLLHPLHVFSSLEICVE